MPSLLPSPTAGQKRKQPNEDALPLKSAKTKPDIALLEQQIQDSQRHFNNIATLLKLGGRERESGRAKLPAHTSLCRVFRRLQADGRLAAPSSNASEKDLALVQWLQARYRDYKDLLLGTLVQRPEAAQELVMTLIMQMVQGECVTSAASALGPQSFYSRAMHTLLRHGTLRIASSEFVAKYVDTHDDLRQHAFTAIINTLGNESTPNIVANCVSFMSAIEPVTPDTFGTIFCPTVEQRLQEAVRKPPSYAAHRKQGAKAWLAVLSSVLTKEQRKTILSYTTHCVVPWFANIEVLMDFLSDSFDMGGASSLLALSGLFYLMQEKNLDYPDFYTKLYSLLDDDLLYSKHRSRFFRLLNVFLDSTHLPAVMVASFIKRLSRLALHAPPAGIVAVIPWVYNMLKAHPTCTFMIHREPRTDEERQEIEEHGVADIFDAEERNPMNTNAIDSCLWELETLQSHYHPNVASLAKIISEQFTKASYNLEDFLDHSYASLVEAELGRDMKKTPVVEFEIRKTVFTGESEGEPILASLMQDMLSWL